MPRNNTSNGVLSVPNVLQFLKDAVLLYLRNEEHSDSILIRVLEGPVPMHKSSSNKTKIEPELLDFFLLVDTLSPRTHTFLKMNFKLGLSKRHTRKLNTR